MTLKFLTPASRDLIAETKNPQQMASLVIYRTDCHASLV
jgi:hypothetical protein